MCLDLDVSVCACMCTKFNKIHAMQHIKTRQMFCKVESLQSYTLHLKKKLKPTKLILFDYFSSTSVCLIQFGAHQCHPLVSMGPETIVYCWINFQGHTKFKHIIFVKVIKKINKKRVIRYGCHIRRFWSMR